MNKTAIKNFAIWARNKLIAEIEYKAGLLGVRLDGIHEALPQSGGGTEFYDVGTKDPYALTGDGVAQRRRLVQAIREKEANSDYRRAFRTVMEEVAYTWFNRLIAVRFMEVNDYLPSRIRVLSSSDGRHEPDIVRSPFDADLTYSEAEKAQIVALKNDNKLDELFRLLFIKQCNALGDVLPYLFERTADHTELLLNVSFTDRDGVVAHLVGDIPESDFNISETDDEGNTPGQVEIIGWLYQYYNTEPKARVFARPSGEKIAKEDIPAATQLFTPDWIVRYLVENSLGRIVINNLKYDIWTEEEKIKIDVLKSKWKYYIDEAPQREETDAELRMIEHDAQGCGPMLAFVDTTLLDPCMGSGHILACAFDVFMDIYRIQGWSDRDAACRILERNLYGLDIDKRATQLAYFSLMMKGRQYDRGFFRRGIQPMVYCTAADEEGAQYGSLLLVDDPGQEPELPEEPMYWQEYKKKLSIWSYRYLLAQKYDVVVTNPPYMAVSNGNEKLQDYVKKNFPDSKADLFAVFIERCGQLAAKYQAMITQHAWMFLSSFEKLREKLLHRDTVNMAHLGPRAFDEISGEVVQTTAFVMRKEHIPGYQGVYCRLIEPTNEKGKKEMLLSGENRYFAAQDNFSKIPGAPVAYWVNETLYKAFEKGVLLDDIAHPKKGLATTDNNRFLRLWFEVNHSKVGINFFSGIDAQKSGLKWFPLNKGGEYRRWYGNKEYVVNWYDNGAEMKAAIEKRYNGGSYTKEIRSEGRYFSNSITWSALTAGTSSFRLSDYGALFDSAGSSMFPAEEFLFILALMNTKVADYILKIINPTLNYGAGSVSNIPVILSGNENIKSLSTGNISLCRKDWDSFETSWDFKEHPFCTSARWAARNGEWITVQQAYENWAGVAEGRFQQLKANEEELNRIFIDIYGLQDELTPEVEDKDVTVRRADLGRDVRSLLSYAVGCMFGRYSLDVPGLAFAGGDWDDGRYTTFLPDRDNVIPITDEEYFEDDIVGLLCAWLKKVYGPDTLEENLSFIAKALGAGRSGAGKGATSREVIRSYFLKDFFKDHCKIYQKRPIYWLYDSGRQNGFKALVYMHRYDPDTTGKVRADYLHRMEQVYESEIARMQETVDNSPNTREVAAATRRKEKLVKQLKECREYDEKIAHLALARIPIDLDDGVKVNYEKVQTGRDGKNLGILAARK